MHSCATSTTAATLLLLLTFSRTTHGFVAPNLQQPRLVHNNNNNNNKFGLTVQPINRVVAALPPLFATPDTSVEAEAERLRSMAAKLRAEAAALEAEQAQEIAEATERAFRKFDTNQDGEISLSELKEGLEKVLKTELDDERVNKLMAEFDASGDGALQLDEFVGIDRFRNRLDALVREEKEVAANAKRQAIEEAEQAQLAAAKMELINDQPPTNTDKLISVLPYLFPLLDGLQFGRFLLQGEESNPIVTILALIFVLYRSVPFSGFLAFFALSTFSGNLGLNRLVRFNMQQAIFLDIALFVPGLIAGIYTLVLSGMGVEAPVEVTQLGTDAVFVALMATLGYSVISSLLGITPDKIPFISEQVGRRMPTIDMLDDEGRLLPRSMREEQDEKKKDD